MTKRIITAAYTVIMALLVALIVGLSLSPAYNVSYYFNPLTTTSEVEYSLNDGSKDSLSLPHRLTGLETGDKVSVFLKSSGLMQDSLLIEANKVHCVVYVQDSPYFSVGNEGTYPAFQKEPPRSIDIVTLPNVAEGTEIRIDYHISSVSNSLEINPYYSGDQNLITKQVIMESYLSLIFSMMILVAGIILAIIGLVFYSRVELAMSLFWLGLVCLACGCWTFFANDVTLLFFSQFTAFYSASLVGFFLLPLPLGRFCITFLEPFRSKVLDIVFYVLCVLFAALSVSHLTGFISFGQAEPFYRLICPLVLTAFVVILFAARNRQTVRVSPLLILGLVLFSVLSIFDAVSGYLGIKSPEGTFFMVGLFFASIVVALLVWEYLSDALDALEKNARLEADISAINRSLDLQRKHFQDFSSSIEETRRIRHDLRHQLVAIQGYITEHKEAEALDYIEGLTSTIPSLSDMLICENVAVNALAVHYRSEAEAAGIQYDIKLVVPTVVGRIPDADLSIIVGNLFENAIEACLYVEPDKRFIRIRGDVTAKRFTLVIDNSFDGELHVSGDDFYSRKRKGFGIGIASVRSVVGKYDGGMKYETEPGVFKTSLYVKL